MKVRLIQSTNNMVSVIYTAATTCYNPGSPIDKALQAKIMINKDKLKLIEQCIKSGHHSVLEHGVFTFAIEGISRACSHQLVRHRHCSYSQQSQRYVSMADGFACVVPKSIAKQETTQDIFDSAMIQLKAAYLELINSGVKPEDARSILPNACCTNIVVTMNLRELIHICNERLCTKAQSEIRMLVHKMCLEVLEQEEWLEPYLQPKCEILGYCREHKSCGRKETLK